ncbi:ribonuclease J [Mycoplasmopsis agassizii]|uniref:ribonuclease J n=1 Tax=Mycoplasmopsis agassizii TaxID=33922 RepID=UPI003527F60A
MTNIKFFGLGGFKEIGKSTLLIESQEAIILIDSGIKFADSATTGLNGMIPNYQYLIDNNHKLRALFITHGHEDHIGGVLFLIQQVNLKTIYAPKIAIEFLGLKFKEHGVGRDINFIEIKADQEHQIDDMVVDFWTAQHSIPEAFGIRVTTKHGKFLMTGDYRFDMTPIGNLTDFDKLKQIGDENLTVLFSDSTNAMRPGHSPSEKDILTDIENIIIESPRKVIVTGFASNLTRMKEILLLGVKHGRKIAIFGRSMVNAIEIGRKLKYLKVDDNVFINKKEIDKYDERDIMVLTTGSQGEELAALSRMSFAKHPQIKVKNGDVIIFSSSPIPGNRMKIELLINRLYKLGATIKENGVDGYLHTSGHAYIHEHIKTFQLTRPKYFIPYHGDYRMEISHGNTAIEQGVLKENILYPSLGQVCYMENETVRVSDEFVDVKPTYIDGGVVLEENSQVVTERYLLGESGFVKAVVVIDKKRNSISGRPRIISKGSLFVSSNKDFIEECNKLVHASTLYMIKNDPEWTLEKLKELLKERLEVFFYKKKRRRPVILASILFTNMQDERILSEYKRGMKPGIKNKLAQAGEIPDEVDEEKIESAKPKKRKRKAKTKTQNGATLTEVSRVSSVENIRKLMPQLRKEMLDDDDDDLDREDL